MLLFIVYPELCLLFPVCCWPPVRSSVTAVKVTEGEAAILTCQYSVKRFGVSHVCWGRDCGTFWCNDILLQTDENGMISKLSDRYRLTGDALAGRLDLLILQAQRTDSGLYCCRVDIDGIFNDKKVTHSLRVIKGGTFMVCGILWSVSHIETADKISTWF